MINSTIHHGHRREEMVNITGGKKNCPLSHYSQISALSIWCIFFYFVCNASWHIHGHIWENVCMRISVEEVKKWDASMLTTLHRCNNASMVKCIFIPIIWVTMFLKHSLFMSWHLPEMFKSPWGARWNGVGRRWNETWKSAESFLILPHVMKDTGSNQILECNFLPGWPNGPTFYW